MSRPGGRAHATLAALALACALAACRAPEGSTAALEAIEAAEDARLMDAEFWSARLAADAPLPVRERAARALGRLRQPALAPLLADALGAGGELDSELLFALGQCGNPAVLPALGHAFMHPLPAARARAVEAFGKLAAEAPADDAIALLAPVAATDRDARVRGQAWLALTRLYGRRAARPTPLDTESAAALRSGLAAAHADSDPGVRWRAAYALSEIEIPDRIDLLVAAAREEERLVRFFAVRGLMRLRDDPDRRLEALLGIAAAEADPHILATALEGLAGSRDPRARTVLLAALARRASPADHHARRAAAAALGHREAEHEILPDASPEVLAALRRAAQDEIPAVRSAALQSLVALDPAGTTTDLATAAAAAAWRDRVAAATATRALPEAGAMPLLERLAADASPQVAAEALAAVGARDPLPSDACRLARVMVPSPDIAVRSGALGLLGRCGGADDLGLLDAALLADPGAAGVEGRLEAVAALASLAERDPRARGGALALLDRAAADSAAAVRSAVVSARARLQGSPAPSPPGPPAGALGGGPPSTVTAAELEALRRAGGRPRVVLRTTRGDLLLELFAADAPRHVASFLRLAEGGFYDGLSLHRVVSGFVVQGLDPRGDGWGSGDVFLRDEINPIAYEAGTVGMPNSGPDTAGCQIFITHVPTPHLDGRYTVFGRVTAGFDVLDALAIGDRCLQVRVLRS